MSLGPEAKPTVAQVLPANSPEIYSKVGLSPYNPPRMAGWFIEDT